MPIIGYKELKDGSQSSIDDEEMNTDDAIYALIKRGVNRPFKHNNKYYMSTGVSSSGSSVSHVMGLIDLNKALAKNPELKYKVVFFTCKPKGVGFSFYDGAENELCYVIPMDPVKRPFWKIKTSRILSSTK